MASLSTRCIYLGTLAPKTPLSSCYWEISHPRFYIWLSCLGYLLCSKFIRRLPIVLVLWACSYLCRLIATILSRVTQIGPSLCFNWFFLECSFFLFFFSLREMCCYFTFGLLLLLSVRSIWRGLLKYARYPVCDQADTNQTWIGLVSVSPFRSNLFLFSSFCLKLSYGVYMRYLCGNIFPIFSFLGTV